MVTIECKLLGSPVIAEDHEEVFIPFGKVSGVLFYILIKKSVSRDELAGVFWAETNDERAKISLRNALHKIRRTFSCDLIKSPNKSMLVLNNEIDLIIDVDQFEKDPSDNLTLYHGDFLKGFHVKGAPEFEEFVIEKRNYLKELYINSSLNKVKYDLENNNNENIESNLIRLISIDNYNDQAYDMLMKFHFECGRYDKVINEYHTIKKIFLDELGIEPSQEINHIYKEAIQKVNKTKSKNSEPIQLFYKRSYEMETLQKVIDEFESDKTSKVIVIRGETGIGKSLLKKKILENNKNVFRVYDTTCYSVEKNFSFSSWMKIISLLDHDLNGNKSQKPILWDDVVLKLFPEYLRNNVPISKILEEKENFDSGLILNVISQALKMLSDQKKIIIAIDDIHFLDKESAKILSDMILFSDINVMFLLTMSYEKNEKVENMIVDLMSVDKISVLNLTRFTKEDVASIVKRTLGEAAVGESEIEDIYEKTGGNALFLNEYLELYKNNKKNQLFTKKINDILKAKISRLTEEEKNVIEVMSLFYKEVNIDHIIKLVNINSFELVKIFNSLENLNIIEEKQYRDEIYLKFTHSTYKDFVYQTLNPLARKILHKEIATMLESERINNHDVTSYFKIQYHYNLANDMVKTLKYEVYILNYYLSYNHELFPDLDEHNLYSQQKKYINNTKAIKLLNDVESSILNLKNSINTKSEKSEIDDIELLYMYCKGRYLIRCGEYGEGTFAMDQVIRMASDMNDPKMMSAGYKQMIIYGIQINNSQIMLKYISKAMKVCKSLCDNNELGIYNRLYGLYFLMIGKESKAENFFNKSVDLFTKSGRIESINTISVSACYNYIGEIRRSNRLYEEAIIFFNKAINLCNNTEISCLAIFYINVGKTYFLKGDRSLSKKYLLMAKDIVEQFDVYWNKVVLDSLLAIIYFFEEKYDKASVLLEDASNETKTIKNSRDRGAVYFAYTVVSFHESLANNKKNSSCGLDLEPPEVYYDKAIRYLDEFRDKGEINYLKFLKKERETNFVKS